MLDANHLAVSRELKKENLGKPVILGHLST
jgi:hypothetical protein